MVCILNQVLIAPVPDSSFEIRLFQPKNKCVCLDTYLASLFMRAPVKTPKHIPVSSLGLCSTHLQATVTLALINDLISTCKDPSVVMGHVHQCCGLPLVFCFNFILLWGELPQLENTFGSGSGESGHHYDQVERFEIELGAWQTQ